MGKTLIAMSGGVDSSVAVRLMQEQGEECVGVTMSLFPKSAGVDDTAAARDVAKRLGVPFYVADYQDEFKKEVIESFIQAYLHGQTPNPCVVCNKKLKFGKLLDRAAELECDKIVTGHYAKIEKDTETYLLKKAEDR